MNFLKQNPMMVLAVAGLVVWLVTKKSCSCGKTPAQEVA